MKSQGVKPTAIVGVVLLIIGIVIIAFIAYGVIGIISHDFDRDQIGNLFNSSYMILFGIIFGIPFVVCILPGYYLVKSANKKP
jgi:uncharacterized membrane protein (Fun14 family)